MVRYREMNRGTVLKAHGADPPSPFLHITQDLRKKVDLSRAEDEIECRHASQQLLSSLLSHATGDAHDHVGVVLLELVKAPHDAVGLLLRFLPDRAGIDQDNVGLLPPLRLLISVLFQQGEHSLGVMLVHLTTEGLDVDPPAHNHHTPDSTISNKKGGADPRLILYILTPDLELLVKPLHLVHDPAVF
jgi:hypothetical protein